MKEEINVLIKTRGTRLEDIERAQLVVTNHGALIKNLHGAVAPGNDLCCNLTKMTVTTERVDLHFPEGECCDMGAAVLLCTLVSPSVTIIQTWSCERLDTRYQKTEDGWKGLQNHILPKHHE